MSADFATTSSPSVNFTPKIVLETWRDRRGIARFLVFQRIGGAQCNTLKEFPRPQRHHDRGQQNRSNALCRPNRCRPADGPQCTGGLCRDGIRMKRRRERPPRSAVACQSRAFRQTNVMSSQHAFKPPLLELSHPSTSVLRLPPVSSSDASCARLPLWCQCPDEKWSALRFRLRTAPAQWRPVAMGMVLGSRRSVLSPQRKFKLRAPTRSTAMRLHPPYAH